VRILKSPLYEARFEECAQTFEERQKELLVALLMFTSKGIHSANASLTEAKETLRSTQKKVDLILLFQVLQTPREKKILAFIETNGGAEACMRDDELLRELLKLRKEWGFFCIRIIYFGTYRSTEPVVMSREGYQHPK